jgi:hypothetical protein
LNGNGIQDPGDLGQGGVTVRLYSLGADGLPYTGDDVLERTLITDADGRYVFLALPAGQYYVAVDTSTVPATCGVNSSTGGGGDPDQGDHPSPPGDDGVPGTKAGEVVSGVITVSVNGQTTPDIDNPPGYTDASAYMTVDFGFTNDPNAIGLREFRAQTPSLADWLASWLRSLLRY